MQSLTQKFFSIPWIHDSKCTASIFPDHMYQNQIELLKILHLILSVTVTQSQKLMSIQHSTEITYSLAPLLPCPVPFASSLPLSLPLSLSPSLPHLSPCFPASSLNIYLLANAQCELGLLK